MVISLVRWFMNQFGIPPVSWRVVCIRDDKTRKAIISTVIERSKWATDGEMAVALMEVKDEYKKFKVECASAWDCSLDDAVPDEVDNGND